MNKQEFETVATKNRNSTSVGVAATQVAYTSEYDYPGSFDTVYCMAYKAYAEDAIKELPSLIREMRLNALSADAANRRCDLVEAIQYVDMVEANMEQVRDICYSAYNAGLDVYAQFEEACKWFVYARNCI